MTLKIVGAGFGRTGTLSLKQALETLGFGPCYHMLEVHQNPEHVAIWSDAAEGASVDWDALYEGWGSTVDWPSTRFWRELADHFPNAKVLLSVRDAERWYESVQATIYQAMQIELPDSIPDAFRHQAAMARKIVLEQTFDNRFEDRDHAIGVYERHNQAVRDAFEGSDRFLEFEVASGWQPLCKFLGVEIPSEIFPRVNDTESFRERMSLGAIAAQPE